MIAGDVSVVVVVGAGTMGPGIAGNFARAGCTVRLVDLTNELLQRGMHRLWDAQEVLVAADLLSGQESADALGRIHPLTDLERACDQAQFLIEAAPEDLTLKQELFRSFDALCPPNAVLASTTSGLSITKLGGATERPALVAGMHFWNPPHIIPLVEVIKGEETTDGAADLLIEMGRRIGKRPILIQRDVPGFVGNRLQFAVLREALYLLSEGIASAEDIDIAMTAGPGLRYGLLGPLRTADLGGLDVFEAISTYLFPLLDASSSVPALLTKLVSEGKLGAKAGEGLYEYPEAHLGDIIAQRDRVLLGFLSVLSEQGAR